MFNVIIIGGNAAGCKAASRLSRICPGYRVTIIEKNDLLSFSSCGLPLYASGEVDDFYDLVKTSYGVIRDVNYFRDVKGVKVLTNSEAVDINEINKTVICLNIKTNETFKLNYDALIIATGSVPKLPSFSFPKCKVVSSFHSPEDSKNFRIEAQQGKVGSAAIIGGGFIGCEMTEALTSLWGIKTVLIEKETALLPGCLDEEISRYIENLAVNNNIELRLSTAVDKIEFDDKEKLVVAVAGGGEIFADYVFYCLGVKPNTKAILNSGIKTGVRGGIIVDDKMRTNVPCIWAAGDCTEIKNIVTGQLDFFSYGSIANRMGRTAADSIAGRSASFSGAAGTFSLKMFDNLICASGITEQKADKLGIAASSVLGCWRDRPDYHPESKTLVGKLVYEKQTMKLLGLQLVGEGEVTRYIDVFSLLLNRGAEVEDLLKLEHGYTPAHSSPISPLNNLGYMAVSQEIDGIINYNPLRIPAYKGILIDVREEEETEAYPFARECVKIPLSILRNKVSGFGSGQSIMFLCERGARSYEAARIFKNSGYKNVAYLGGGSLVFGKLNEFIKFTGENYEL